MFVYQNIKVKTTIKSTKLITTRLRTRSTTTTNPNYTAPTHASVNAEEKKRKARDLDFKKLFKVIATILGISILALLLTILVSRLTARLNKRKKKKGALSKDKSGMQSRNRTNSSSSSATQVTLNNAQANVKRKTITMPPSVMPASSLQTGVGASGAANKTKHMSIPNQMAHSFSTAPDLSALRKNYKPPNDEVIHLMHENNTNESSSNNSAKTVRVAK